MRLLESNVSLVRKSSRSKNTKHLRNRLNVVLTTLHCSTNKVRHLIVVRHLVILPSSLRRMATTKTHIVSKSKPMRVARRAYSFLHRQHFPRCEGLRA